MGGVGEIAWLELGRWNSVFGTGWLGVDGWARVELGGWIWLGGNRWVEQGWWFPMVEVDLDVGGTGWIWVGGNGWLVSGWWSWNWIRGTQKVGLGCWSSVGGTGSVELDGQTEWLGMGGWKRVG